MKIEDGHTLRISKSSYLVCTLYSYVVSAKKISCNRNSKQPFLTLNMLRTCHSQYLTLFTISMKAVIFPQNKPRDYVGGLFSLVGIAICDFRQIFWQSRMHKPKMKLEKKMDKVKNSNFASFHTV